MIRFYIIAQLKRERREGQHIIKSVRRGLGGVGALASPWGDFFASVGARLWESRDIISNKLFMGRKSRTRFWWMKTSLDVARIARVDGRISILNLEIF